MFFLSFVSFLLIFINVISFLRSPETFIFCLFSMILDIFFLLYTEMRNLYRMFLFEIDLIILSFSGRGYCLREKHSRNKALIFLQHIRNASYIYFDNLDKVFMSGFCIEIISSSTLFLSVFLDRSHISLYVHPLGRLPMMSFRIFLHIFITFKLCIC